MKTQVNIKLDPIIKQQAQDRAESLGLSLSAVVNATLSQFARTGEMHITPVSEHPTPHLQKILQEAEEEYRAGKTHGPFSTVDALMEDLEK
jgi:addiction module RelB/DinJ family antitoxin